MEQAKVLDVGDKATEFNFYYILLIIIALILIGYLTRKSKKS